MNIYNETDCDFCIHESVCKRKDGYTEAVKEFQTWTKDIKFNQLDDGEYSIRLRCNDYQYIHD